MKISSIPFAGFEVRLPEADGRGARLAFAGGQAPRDRSLRTALDGSRQRMSRVFGFLDRQPVQSRLSSGS